MLELHDDAGRPLDAAREYLVVTNNFRAQGGDGFDGFLGARGLVWTEHRVRDVVREALIYRRGLVGPGQVLAEVKLNPADLLRLQGTPLPQDASLDELSP